MLLTLLSWKPSFAPYQVGEGFIRDRDRKIKREREEKEELRRLIERAVDPIREKEVTVVDDGVNVEILLESSPPIVMPAMPQFDVAEVVREVLSVLREQQIRARHMAIVREQAAKIMKRRRDDELLLLLS